jgi:hypothetical protein
LSAIRALPANSDEYEKYLNENLRREVTEKRAEENTGSTAQ